MSESAVENSVQDDNADVVTNFVVGGVPDKHESSMSTMVNPLDVNIFFLYNIFILFVANDYFFI